MAQQINLFNPVFLKQRKLFSAVAMAQALALIAVGTACFSGYLAYRGRQIEATVARIDATTAEQRATFLKLVQEHSPQGRSKLLEEELARVETQLKSRQELAGALRAEGLGNTAGFARYLTAFARQPVAGVWLTGIRLDGDDNQLVLDGRVLQADLVPLYLRALSKEEVMRGRQVDSLKLTVRESPPAAPADAKAPAKAPGAERAATQGPSSYVEFSLTAVRSAGPKDAAAAAPKAGS